MLKKKPTTVEIQGRQLRCLVCNHDQFFHRRILLNSPLLTLFRLDWLDKSSNSVICENCGYVHTFMP